jgi:hypothetical protein
MTKLYSLLAFLAVLVPGESAPAGDQPAGDNKLAGLERFAGEWIVDGKWSDGSVLQARTVYEWSLGKKILRSQTFVTDKGKEYQRYESIMAWHPEKKSLYVISFTFDGTINEVLIDSKDKDTFNIGWTPFTEGKPSQVRQVLRFLDKDRYQWIVSLRDGDQWKQLIDATWKRKAR